MSLSKSAILILSAWLFLIACNKSGDQDAIVAQVGDKKLTWAQLMEVIPDNTTALDSSTLAERYIQDWTVEQVVLNMAEESLPEEMKSFDLLIENYRKSLLIHAYEQEWIRQKLDTAVNEEEIEQYYINNEKNFQLKNYILKVKFCAVASDSKNISALSKLFYSAKPEDLVKLEQMCIDIGASYYFNEDQWMIWEEFIAQVPLDVFDIESFLKKKKNIEFEKDNNLYLITITDYQLSGSRSPISFEREKIKSMIVNRRKLELLDVMRKDLFAKAQQEKLINIYNEKK